MGLIVHICLLIGAYNRKPNFIIPAIIFDIIEVVAAVIGFFVTLFFASSTPDEEAATQAAWISCLMWLVSIILGLISSCATISLYEQFKEEEKRETLRV